ncbi:hypothetical protein [Bradyrhizobium sp. Tv2a-2]|nr:hypothetical protein [Bradyrhizobium sp. Tv2a-2]
MIGERQDAAVLSIQALVLEISFEHHLDQLAALQFVLEHEVRAARD